MEFREGDIVTFDDVLAESFRVKVPNPDRQWWQFWKPRIVLSPLRKEFRIVGTVSGASSQGKSSKALPPR